MPTHTQRSITLSMLSVLLLALFAPLASAADCSSAQIAAIQAFDANATAVCGSSLLSTSAASVICARPECLSYIVSLEAQVPYCDIAGVNIRTIFAFASSYCAQTSNETDTISYTNQPSAAVSRYATSAGGSTVIVTLVIVLLAMLA